jgi:hypothetical protein
LYREFENILKLWPEGYILEDASGRVIEEDVAGAYRGLLGAFNKFCTEPPDVI